MLLSDKQFTNASIAKTIGCTMRSIEGIRSRLRSFATTRTPCHPGPSGVITPSEIEHLRTTLAEAPMTTLEELDFQLKHDFGCVVSERSVTRALASIGISKRELNNRSKVEQWRALRARLG